VNDDDRVDCCANLEIEREKKEDEEFVPFHRR
jgi:hypothetical protein